jgi:hypothetical protein
MYLRCHQRRALTDLARSEVHGFVHDRDEASRGNWNGTSASFTQDTTSLNTRELLIGGTLCIAAGFNVQALVEPLMRALD